MATPMSAEKLLKRGYCCGLKCKNCPYFPRYKKGNKKIMSDKTPNKHIRTFGSLDSYSFTYDDQENEWQQLSDNFYFLEEGRGETLYFDAKTNKRFFYDSNE